MKDLIKALQILAKYANDSVTPTACGHDEFVVSGCGIEIENVTAEDQQELASLGFYYDLEHEAFASFRFGNC